MFEFVRTHKKWLQVILVLLIAPSFIFVGISSYGGGGGAGAEEVANVGGQKITRQEWENAQRNQMDRFRQQLGDRFDPKMFETPEAKKAILDSLIAERAIEAEIKKNHMTIGDVALQRRIAEEPAFRKPDGSFDMEQYKTLLGQQGMTPLMYQASVRRQLTLQQLESAVQSSAFAPRTVATRIAELGDQEREVQELLLPAADFVAQVKVTDDMIKAFYDKNATLFQVPEQITAEYVVFDSSVVESAVSVTDAEIAKFYEDNKAKNFTVPEQRNARHILVKSKPDASAADKAAAKAKADAILAEVRAAPANFADIAKAKSEDESSAELGGDLGPVKAGDDALPSGVVDAALKLKSGEVSGVVTSEFGLHIVSVNVVPATVKAFDDVKAQIATELKQARMSSKYRELAEQFSNTVEEQFDSLKPVADKLKLTIKSTDKLTRMPSPLLGTDPVNSPKFLKAIFSDDAIKTKRNTDAIEVAPSTLVAGRVVDYKPAAKRPLAEVSDLIRERVLQEEALKLAKKAGDDKIAAAKASGDAAGFGAPKVVSLSKQQQEINMAAVRNVMRADTSKLPAYVGVEVPGLGYGVYRINKVAQPANPDVARRAGVQQQLGQAIAQHEMFDYLAALKTKAKSEIKTDLNANTEAK